MPPVPLDSVFLDSQPAPSLPLTGTEILPLLQSGLDKSATTQNIADIAITNINNNRILAPVADITALKAIGVSSIAKGALVYVETPGKIYQYDPTSTITADNYDYVAPTTGSGNWIATTTYSGIQTNDTIYQSNTTFPAPMPRIIYVFPQSSTNNFTLPPLTAANGFKQNDVFLLVNVASAGHDAEIFLNNGTQCGYLPGPGAQIYYVTAVGNPGSVSGGIALSQFAFEPFPGWYSETAANVLSNIGGLKKSGDILTGALLNYTSSPTNSNELVPKSYVDSSVSPITTGYSTMTAGASITLNNPGGGSFTAATLMDVSLTTAGQTLTLPDMTGSPLALGMIYEVRNPAINTNFPYDVLDKSGATVYSGLNPGQVLKLEITSKASSAGTFRAVAIGNSGCIKAITTSTYTLQVSDNGKYLTFSTTCTVTIPALFQGFNCAFEQLDITANQVNFVNGTGMTLSSRYSAFKTSGQNAVATFMQRSSALGTLTGDLVQ